ncbi:MAG: hypothetical protein HPY73_06810 [Methanomassiliicoccales archaeon]|nr:MAG: hypothetical protein HPY73_06810 [Methanomassiliicoccales archaeon]
MTVAVVFLIMVAPITVHMPFSGHSFKGGQATDDDGLSFIADDTEDGPSSSDTVDVNIPPPRSNSLTGLTMTIDFSYIDRNGLCTIPCAGALVMLTMIGIEGKEDVAISYTDYEGRAVFHGLTNGTYVANIFTKDEGYVQVVGPEGQLYSWSTEPVRASSDVIVTLSIDDDSRAAWSSFTSVRSGAAWLKDNVDWERKMVTIVWPTEGLAHCHGDEIHLPGPMDFSSDAWVPKVVLHEYGHAVHYALRGDSFPDYEGPEKHYIDSETNARFAFLEGWAEFFSAAAMGDPTFGGSCIEMTMFADSLSSNGDYGDWDGNEVEGAVANVLWDIFDGISEDDHPLYLPSAKGDQVDRRLQDLWEIMVSERPEEMMDIWRAWDNKTSSLVDIFRYARFDVDLVRPSNPTGFVSSHKVMASSKDSTISIALIGAEDDSSMPIWYSIIWDDRPDTEPDDIVDICSDSLTSPSLPPGIWYLHVRSIDYSGNVANGTLHLGPFLIEEGATDISDSDGHSGLNGTLLMDILILIGTIMMAVILIIIVMKMVRRPQEGDVGMTDCQRSSINIHPYTHRYGPRDIYSIDHQIGCDENFCPYCGKKDLHGLFCAYCGKRLR